MQPHVITINFNEEKPTPKPISVRNGTRITFRIILPPDLKLTPTITFCDTDPDACILTINDPTHDFVFTEEKNTYEHDFVPQIDKTKAPTSQDRFIRNYVVKLVETVPPRVPSERQGGEPLFKRGTPHILRENRSIRRSWHRTSLSGLATAPKVRPTLAARRFILTPGSRGRGGGRRKHRLRGMRQAAVRPRVGHPTH